MRIGLLSPMPGLGGTEKQNLALARLFEAKGHQVCALVTKGPLTADLAPYCATITSAGLLGLRSWLRKAQPQILSLQMARWLPYACMTGRPVVWHARGIKPSSYPFVVRFCNWQSVQVVANCKAEHDKLIRYGLRPNLAHWANNLVEPRPAPERGGKSGLVMASRLTKTRGVDQAIKAFGRAKLPDHVKLTIVGDGPERCSLKALAHPFANRVQFVGGLTDPWPYQRAAQVCLNTPLMTRNFGAGHGNALIEGAMAGCALISYTGSAADELVDETTGALVQSGQVHSLTDHIKALFADPKRLTACGIAARARALTLFDADTSYQRICLAYDQALKR